MPDQKISQLTAGGAAQATDLLPVARSGTNVSLLAKDIATALERLAASGQSLTSAQATSLVDLAATWNTTGTPTAIKLNVTDTASNAASLLMDLQVGGSSRFAISKLGVIRLTSNGGLNFLPSLGNYGIFVGGGGYVDGLRFAYGDEVMALGPNKINMQSGALLSWSSTTASSGTPDVVLVRDAAQTLAQRNGVNAQTFRLYNTFTDASNYERGKLEWASNVLRIGTEKAGTGTARALELQTDGTTRATISTAGLTTLTFDTAQITSGLIVRGSNAVNYWTLGTDLTSNNSTVVLTGGTTGLVNVGAGMLHLTHSGTTDSRINSFNNLIIQPGGVAGGSASSVVEQRNGTNAQTFNIYNTFTSATNYERLSIAATAAGAVRIRTNKGSGGGTARALELGTDDTTHVTIPTTGGCVVGTAALATNATDGFLYVPTCAGTPTGTPTAQTGTVPIVVDTTNNKLYFYSGAAWRDAGP